MFSVRMFRIFNIFFAALVLGLGYYAQRRMGLVPCILCELQRLVWCALVFTGLGAYRTQSPRFFDGLSLGLIVLGLSLALRQMWIQLMPGSAPTSGACFPSLGPSFWHRITQALTSNGACHDASVTFFNLPMSVWSALGFVMIAFVIMKIKQKS